MKKTTAFNIAGIAFVCVLFGTAIGLWCIRERPEAVKAECKATSKAFRKLPVTEVVPYLERLYAERRFTVRFSGKAPFLGMGWETRVPMDFVAQLCEDAFFRFAGESADVKGDTAARIRALLAFAPKFLAEPGVTDATKNGLQERRLDAFFLTGDYDGAINLLENEIRTHSPGWRRGTAAKLRAHRALEKGKTPENCREAVKQFLVFGEYMLSDEMKDFEDADPATGIVYSREWVAARNYMRCATYAKEAGDAADAAKYAKLAAPLFKQAAEKAKEDEHSAKELAKEMKSAGL